MSQAQISVDETASSTKQTVGIKEKLKLNRSSSNAQAANWREMVGSSIYYTKMKKSRKGSKSCLAEKPNLQEAAEKSRGNWQSEQKGKKNDWQNEQNQRKK